MMNYVWGKKCKYRIRKVQFTEHPVLKDIVFDFTDKSGNAVDTVIIAGENGTGKSTLIDELFKLVLGGNKSPCFIEYEIEGSIILVEIRRYSESSVRFFYYNSNREQIAVQLPEFAAIYSDVDINFNSGSISSVTSLSLDETERSKRSNSNLPTTINQLLVDIQALDDADDSRQMRDNPNKTFAELLIDHRMDRFSKAFERMFENMNYYGIENMNGRKVVLFKKNNTLIPIDALSSGEKQIVYRGSFLLSDINALNGAFVFIDEPEISLHPEWQKKILDYYRSIFSNAQNKQTSQIFLVTHSPFIIHNDNRRNDKVIVLHRNNDGLLQIKSSPDYYKCNSIEVVKDAFNIDFYNEGKSTVYLEGRTDEKYFKRVVEVYNRNVPFSFKWVGYLNENGQEENTGSGALKQAYQFLVSVNSTKKNVCLFDSDTRREASEKNNAFSRTIRSYNNSKNIKKGIENALILDDIDLKSFYTPNEKIGDYGEVKNIPEFEKMRFCDYICSLDNETLVKVFANLNKEIDLLDDIFR